MPRLLHAGVQLLAGQSPLPPHAVEDRKHALERLLRQDPNALPVLEEDEAAPFADAQSLPDGGGQGSMSLRVIGTAPALRAPRRR